jgi:hypothetical protein
MLYAIPKAAADAEQNREALIRAAGSRRIAGVSWIAFGAETVIPVTDPRDEITVRYRVERASHGGVVFVSQQDITATRPADDPDSQPHDGRETNALGWVAAGIAGAAGVALAGLWLVRRRR